MLDNKEITKQVIDGQKAALEAGFNSIFMLQEQATQAMDNFLKQSPWIPIQTKSIINDWAGIYRKSTKDLKEATDQNYAKLEEALTSGFTAFQPKSKK